MVMTCTFELDAEPTLTAWPAALGTTVNHQNRQKNMELNVLRGGLGSVHAIA